jgi:gluconolactonase
MKLTLLGVSALLLTVACGGEGGSDKPSNTAGAGNVGGGGASGGGGSAGMSSGGTPSQSGSGTGGSAAGSGGNAGGGAGGSSGGSGGGSPQSFQCPATVDAAKLTGLVPMRVQGVPPADDFNGNNSDGTNLEGPVWLGDALYVSEIAFTKGTPPPARVLKVTADGKVTVVVPPDAGTNGLAIGPQGELWAAVHKDGSVSKLDLVNGTVTPVVATYMGKRFDSPNDLTFHSNGTLYFSDPDWQAPQPAPQTAQRAYRVPPGGGEPIAIEELDKPNGMTLSKKQDFLYIGGNQLRKYPVMADGSLGAGSNFLQSGSGNSDGMVIDCADNLYTTGNGVTVYSAAGVEIGKISVNGLSSVTNVAFGGVDRKTLYITSQGTADQKGLWQVPMNVPGMPY